MTQVASSALPTFREIGALHNTDKVFYHGYDTIYDPLFSQMRDHALNLLEIGIWRGASLRTWRDYFHNGKIVGADIEASCADIADLGPRVSVEIGDATRVYFVGELVKKHGPFDIIIDDGSHEPEHQWKSLNLLMPHLVPGGLYIIEDLNARRAHSEPSLMKRMTEMLDRLVKCAYGSIEEFHAWQKLIVLKKKSVHRGF